MIKIQQKSINNCNFEELKKEGREWSKRVHLMVELFILARTARLWNGKLGKNNFQNIENGLSFRGTNDTGKAGGNGRYSSPEV